MVSIVFLSSRVSFSGVVQTSCALEPTEQRKQKKIIFTRTRVLEGVLNKMKRICTERLQMANEEMARLGDGGGGLRTKGRYKAK